MSRTLHAVPMLIFILLLSCRPGRDAPIRNALRMASERDQAVVIDQNSIRFRVEKRSSLAASTEANLLRQSIYALYKPSIAPYPGLITRQVACEEFYLPEEVQKKTGDLEFHGFKLYANKRYTLGACGKTEAEFKVFKGLVFCPGERIFEVQFFQRVNSEPDRFYEYLRLLSCA